MGLRLKLGIYVVGFVFTLLALVGFLGVRAERRIYYQEMQHRGLTLLRSLSIPAAIAMANNDITTLDNIVVQFAEAATSMDLRYIAVLDYSGRVLAHTVTGEFGKTYDDPFTREAMSSAEPLTQLVHGHGEPLLELTVPVVSGLRWGTLEAGFTLATIERTIARNRNRSILMSVAVSLGVAAIAYLVLSLLVIRPVVRMANMARRFGGGDLQARVELSNDDEIGRLASQLNGMAQQIQDYTGGLERLVQERTVELADANAKLVDANRQLDRLAKTDGLTGLYNRRHFMEQLEFEIRRGARTRRQFTLVLLDVDHFKHYNDSNGHTAGDELLQRLATLLELNLRSVDLVARYGGEEFIILLFDTGLEKGRATATKLQQVVAAQPFPQEESQPGGKLTISLGVSFYPQDSCDSRTLIEMADQALYRSKADGRNRVTLWAETARSVGA